MSNETSKSLDPIAIIDDATTAEGFEWDRSPIMEPLHVILEAIASEAKLHEAGTVGAGNRNAA